MSNETRNVRSEELKKDEYAFNALSIMEDYNPAHDEYSLEAVTALYMDMKAKQKTEVQKEGELKAARDSTSAAEYAFHQVMLQVKNQVRALFGDESNELQSLGLKKKSERKAPRRKPKNAE